MKKNIEFLLDRLNEEVDSNLDTIEKLQTSNKVLNKVIDSLEDILEKDSINIHKQIGDLNK